MGRPSLAPGSIRDRQPGTSHRGALHPQAPVPASGILEVPPSEERVDKGSGRWPGLQWDGFPKNVTFSAFPSLDLTFPGLKVGCRP